MANGLTAAMVARHCNHPMIFSLLDREAAEAEGDKLRARFTSAELVHVISTRFRRDPSQLPPHVEKDRFLHPLSCDPFMTAQNVKKALERSDGCMTFDPNGDNAFLMKGDSSSADAIWLRNWRWALELARKTGGCCVQIVVKPGLSEMQKAEADMADDKGVRVVRLDCSEVVQTVNLIEPKDGTIRQCAYEADLAKLEGWKGLVAGAGAPRIPPLARSELDTLVEKLLGENAKQASENAKQASEIEELVSEIEKQASEIAELRSRLGGGARATRQPRPLARQRTQGTLSLLSRFKATMGGAMARGRSASRGNTYGAAPTSPAAVSGRI